ncbi:MAG TPA: class I SAM-dependent methyltransferase, partial [Gemmatimonadaceae bacterium]
MRTVLDVGCGEGLWAAALRRERPRIRYVGIDPSAYVVQRFGAQRNIRQGDIASLASLDVAGPFDLILCNDVLHYVAAPALHAGMRS